ncbi:MAG: glycosyltransferase family 4 protein [Patescibacteria group bacterium]|jgi:glycosyltransferase involved in cell wall biosynthesis
MRIIFANKYYYLRGGAERHLFDLKTLLESRGHEIIPFAMAGEHDEPSAWYRHFVSPVSTEAVSFGWEGLRTAGRMLYSFEARRKFATLLSEADPDLVHVHNIYHQISPSILPEAKKRQLPVVMTVHDYNLLAPNYSLFHDGRICEVTKPQAYWRAVSHKCVKGSAAASALTALEMSLHRSLGLYKRNIDRYIAPSRFVQALLVEYGFDEKQVSFLPHFVQTADWQPSFSGDYALFVGRLSAEKGVETLIRAAAIAKNVPVHIVGTGPDEARLKKLTLELRATNVVFRGFLAGDDLKREYAGARFVVVPSVWYEVFGLVVLEAYAAGKPVVASEIGGLTELVRAGETGIPVSAGDVSDLAGAMRDLWNHPIIAEKMGRVARSWVESYFTPDQYYAGLMKIYGGKKLS